jgi:hypothetical protein
VKNQHHHPTTVIADSRSKDHPNETESGGKNRHHALPLNNNEAVVAIRDDRANYVPVVEIRNLPPS